MASSPLDRLIARPDCASVGEETVDAFIREGFRVLFFTGDPDQRRETPDVAVILPQLMDQFGDRMSVAVVERQSEMVLKPRFGVMVDPSLVFLKDGEFVGVIPRVIDWLDYVVKIEQFLGAKPPALEKSGLDAGALNSSLGPNAGAGTQSVHPEHPGT
ncbi:MAG: hypothetical protein ACPGOV_13970 [Magnetovibrionaceae bacterium]